MTKKLTNIALTLFLSLPVAALASGAIAQTTNPNNETICDGPGGGADPRCVGVSSPGGLTDMIGFKAYAEQQKHASFSHTDYRVGTVLPEKGVEYRDVPPQFGGKDVHYVVVNGHTVLTDKKTHKVVRVIN